MLCVWGTDGERPNTIHDGRSARAGRVRCGTAALRGGARGALRRGGVGAIAGPRELESALLEADDALMMPSQMCSASAYTAAVTILAMWCDR